MAESSSLKLSTVEWNIWGMESALWLMVWDRLRFEFCLCHSNKTILALFRLWRRVSRLKDKRRE